MQIADHRVDQPVLGAEFLTCKTAAISRRQSDRIKGCGIDTTGRDHRHRCFDQLAFRRVAAFGLRTFGGGSVGDVGHDRAS